MISGLLSGMTNGLGRALLILCMLVPAVQAQEDVAVRGVVGVILPEVGQDESLRAALVEDVEQGAVMAAEEFSMNASLFGIDFQVVVEHSPAARETAARLRQEHGVAAVVGGIGRGDAGELSAWAEESGVPFVNVAATSDLLRADECGAMTFHLAPSAAMYIDALAGWFVRSGFRRWFIVRNDSSEAQDQHERLVSALEERHFAAREVGSSVWESATDYGALAGEIAASGADLIMLLLPAPDQLEALSSLDAAGVEVMTTGFPYPAAQTRAFFDASRNAAPGLGSGFRATSWEPTLDAYGARELNARYLQRWGEPMEAGAWAGFQAVKILYEAIVMGGSAEPEDVAAYLGAENTIFDLWKGIGASFRPWDHQMRQSLYLVKINETSSDRLDAALLVGELPAIYMPGTDPVERLDQLGDLEHASRCRGFQE
ncbi:ABC transporter substrate-binding protein [Roseitranquillus sediminis]|uniref:ABC transporter substrate-binding protein n=1 Tax=Roseitranquillus sediminis TaxID=2809051 RepID=UPI001D0BFDFE|nr:ABC transporter substrate-binding protein [Roseitranquillus sediminis]MBM9595471.1 ABC transporter substrate-binding protein [Roseitranquillus sediminis]